MSYSKWVREKRLIELTGMTHDQIKQRRQNRQWVEKRQWKWGPDGKIWYNPEEIDRWVEQGHAA